MSEANETKGRCYNETKLSGDFLTHHLVIADAIDRLAADVAAVKEMVCGNSPEKPDSSTSASQPAAPTPGWLPEPECRVTPIRAGQSPVVEVPRE